MEIERRENVFIRHSGNYAPVNKEVDVSLSYADYYFVEPLIRFRKIINVA
jgi:unsaturated chondroitin disaccharide hydrolase